MSRLGEVARVKRTLKLFDMILNKHIDSINPEDNSLPTRRITLAYFNAGGL